MAAYEECEMCGRPRATYTDHGCDKSLVVKVEVEHEGYGCDTGCCGHVVSGINAQGQEIFQKFHFDHPYGADWHTTDEEKLTFAKDLVGEEFPNLVDSLTLQDIRVYDD